MTEPLGVHGPASEAPRVSSYVARCVLCGSQYAVRGEVTAPLACDLCGSPVTLTFEGPTFGPSLGTYYRTFRGGR